MAEPTSTRERLAALMDHIEQILAGNVPVEPLPRYVKDKIADSLLAAGLAYRTDVMEEAARELCWHCRDGHPLNERGRHSISSRSDVPCLAAALRAKAKEPA